MSPAIDCSICGKLTRIKTKDWKLVLADQPYVCSPKCVLDWISNLKDGEPAYWFGGEPNELLTPHQMIFRSKFEERFFQWLCRENIASGYELYRFRVGDGWYTPDFYLIDDYGFIETKGKWQLGQRTKFRRFRKQYPNVPILIVPWLLEKEFK